MAIGASVPTNGVSCLRFHRKKTRETGGEETKIQTAVCIGRMVRKEVASKWDEEAEALLGSVAGAVPTDEKDQAEKGCVCP
jgi:hypothetical protein